jgi:hypothetical protein
VQHRIGYWHYAHAIDGALCALASPSQPETLAEFALEVHSHVVESMLVGLVRGRDRNAGLRGTNGSHGCINVLVSQTPPDPVARDCSPELTRIDQP